MRRGLSAAWLLLAAAALTITFTGGQQIQDSGEAYALAELSRALYGPAASQPDCSWRGVTCACTNSSDVNVASCGPRVVGVGLPLHPTGTSPLTRLKGAQIPDSMAQLRALVTLQLMGSEIGWVNAAPAIVTLSMSCFLCLRNWLITTLYQQTISRYSWMERGHQSR
jgi:hypothetical protein